MISVCTSEAVRRLLDTVCRAPGRFRTVALASPFLDEVGVGLLQELDASGGRFALRFLTRPDVAGELRARTWQRLQVVPIAGLHAKIYVVLGMDPRAHEAVVTSANLTGAGLHDNLEFGLHVTASTPSYVHLVERIARWTARSGF